MGKKGSSTSSWLTAVKRAFRSPTKDTSDQKRNTRRKEDHPQDNNDDDEKKREKRRWLFRKPTIHETVPHQQKTEVPVEVVVKNTRARETWAAIAIQTAFRGYLARRALRALKGLVKLQALVRGHNVRKQAKMTLKCMQALVRVQSRVLDQRMRLSHDGTSRKSAFSDTTSLCGSRYLQDIADRKSIVTSRDGSSIANDDWDERPHTIEEVKAMLQSRKDAAALRHERNLSQAFSQQIWRSRRNSSIGGEDEIEEEKPKWLDRWMATKPWEKTRARTSTDQRDSIKTVEIDTSQPYSYLTSSSSLRRPISHHQNQRPSSPHQNQRPSSPHHRSNHSSVTPSPSKSRPVQIRSASPRYVREDRTNNNAPQTPSLRSYNYHYNSGLLNQNSRVTSFSNNNSGGGSGSGGALPNYMAATESAKARVRSQSAPRQRMATPERERNGSVKKRLSYPVPPDLNHHQHLRSPSFKSAQNGHMGFVEQQSNYSSCYTESIGGEISPSSTTELRRWLR